jgi:hypothetical protein
MDIEQLKLILGMVEHVSGDAKIVLIAWFSIEAISTVLQYFMWGVFFWVAYKLATKGISIASDHTFGKTLRQIVMPDSGYGALTAVERKTILAYVKKGMSRDD